MLNHFIRRVTDENGKIPNQIFRPSLLLNYLAQCRLEDAADDYLQFVHLSREDCEKKRAREIERKITVMLVMFSIKIYGFIV